MKSLWTVLAFLATFVALANAASLELSQSIPLPNVEARIDHLAIDAHGQRLFVAALGNGTVEVIDLKVGKVVHTIHDLDEPQGIVYAEEGDLLYIACGGDGSLRMFDGSDFAMKGVLAFGGDADNLRYDPLDKKIYVGFGGGAIAVVNTNDQTRGATIAVGGHPESFQLETKGPRIFVNVPRAHKIAVLDRQTLREVTRWSTGFASANFPMTLDEQNRRAFVGCRVPSRLLVFDTNTGKEVSRFDLHGDCDDLFYDAARRQIYASCGEGYIDVFSQVDANHYSLREAVPTAEKARTCLFDGEHIYLAVPRSGSRTAEIRVYTIRTGHR